MPKFATLKDLEAYLRLVYAPYGYLSDDEWRAMAVTSARRCDSGGITLHYDPKIIDAFITYSQDFNCWQQ